MKSIKEITMQFIEEEQKRIGSSYAVLSLMDVFRENFDLWNEKLFPLLLLLKKNRYEYLVELLALGGYEVSISQVGLYLHKVRAERCNNKKHIKKERV